MLFEQTETREVLGRIVAQVNGDPAWHDDLMQEGTIHLWRLEEERPGQSRSWYLQSCSFFLRHHLAKGRSVDSWKRQDHGMSLFAESNDEERACVVTEDSTATAMSEINAQELLYLLGKRLTSLQKIVLGHLAEGLSSREIGLKLGVSHKAVLKHRLRIAAIARQLGISPLN